MQVTAAPDVVQLTVIGLPASAAIVPKVERPEMKPGTVSVTRIPEADCALPETLRTTSR